jgi:hypothetical protein
MAYPCGMTRRSFLVDTGMGFTGLALGAMLFKDGIESKAHGSQSVGLQKQPHFTPKAKSVIWIFCCGGVSHVDSFDPKPELNKYAGKGYGDTPYYKAMTDPERLKNVKVVGDKSEAPKIDPKQRLMGMIAGYKKYGQSGLEIADPWGAIGAHADDIAIVRSLWTTDNDHGAQMEFHTGRHFREGPYPTLGSWISYGLGKMNQNLPEFVALSPGGCGGSKVYGADYLGPEHAGVYLNVGAKDPIAYLSPAGGIQRDEQQEEFSLVGKLNRLAGIDYPDDPALRAHIKSYETAFGMQTAVPETLQLDKETEATKRLYLLHKNNGYGKLMLVARRLVERGVRFVQIFSGSGCAGGWDHHGGIRQNFIGSSQSLAMPIAGLLQDLKQRGMLDETLVVWGTEFGRTPAAEGDPTAANAGRNHHPYCFSAWLAGGGIKGGITHGATDELGFHAVENRHYVTDIHATVLQQLGLDPRRLEVPGRKRLELDFGKPIADIIA